MSEPLVVAVMLTKDRPAMARRAVESFRSQTYDPVRRLLYIHDTSTEPIALTGSDSENEAHDWRPAMRGQTIGELRNWCNAVLPKPDIICHWDDDDWSHPNRMSEQVALLQASGADAVGYREMLFWRTVPQSVKDNFAAMTAKFPPGAFPLPEHLQLRQDEAWLYTKKRPSHALGTSLMYHRHVWERKPFGHHPVNPSASGEDYLWIQGLNCVGVSSLKAHGAYTKDCEPRMIASIHGGNSTVYEPDKAQGNWQRAPEWNEHCRKVMAHA